jgi:hypothetical protein
LIGSSGRTDVFFHALSAVNFRLGGGGGGSMGKANRSAPCLFLPYSRRGTLPKDAIVYDVSSYADPPYCTLSPM